MEIARACLRYKTLTLVAIAALVIGGIVSFLGLGQLEDPEFTIFTAIVSTPYPGASAVEVEQEVSDRLETAVQTMGAVETVRSISRPGLSMLIVDLYTTTPQDKIPQAWDELRRKIGDVQRRLPPGAGPTLVNDDWGDVYGIFFAITGDGYDLTELEDYATILERELLQVDGVGSVELWGTQTEAVYVEIPRVRMAELGVGPRQLFGTLQSEGAVVPDGRLHTGDQYVRIAPSGSFESIEEMRDLLIRSPGSESLVRLGDVATVRKGLLEPSRHLMLFNGKPAIGLGIATVEGGNVVTTGAAVQKRLNELEPLRPLGMDLQVISYQPATVTEAVDGFLLNLVSAVAIVIGLLMLFMGLRSGLIIGVVLMLDILGTFIYMSVTDISLQRISLGALIIALGMLVDNAIVVIEGILVRIRKGRDRTEAAVKTVEETKWPLLGATVVAILAFAAISLSDDVSGEFLASLFHVIAASLLLSWILAVTVTPLLGVLFLDRPAADGEADPYDHRFFRAYRRLLHAAVRHRWITLGAMAVLLIASVLGFGSVTQSFFPDSSRPQLYIDYWRSEGTHIEDTVADLEKISAWLLDQEGVTTVTTFAGEGALRFILTYEPQLPSTSYGQLLITVDDADRINELEARADRWIHEHFPDAQPRIERFVFGPPTGAKIEARLSGDDPQELRRLAEQARAVMRADPSARSIRDDWRQQVPVIRPVFAEAQARNAGISRQDLAASIAVSTSGSITGLYREGDDLMPVVFRLPAAERAEVDQLESTQIWSSITGRVVPMQQVVDAIRTEWDDAIIRRRDRRRTVTVQCDPAEGVASTLLERLRPKIEAIELPVGYRLEWGGEYESSTKANSMLMASVPLFFGLMVLIVVALFNSIRQPLIVFATLPLALIGVTAGLLVTGEPFGFVALLGFLSLSGMLIKNAVVLLDQIDLNLEAGQPAMEAVLDAGVSRVRPVMMAAFTTVLGMTPLLVDIFWSAMAVTIMAGLSFATVLTLVVVPVLYTILYRVPRTAPATRLERPEDRSNR